MSDKKKGVKKVGKRGRKAVSIEKKLIPYSFYLLPQEKADYIEINEANDTKPNDTFRNWVIEYIALHKKKLKKRS